jgi:hypothetical protein
LFAVEEEEEETGFYPAPHEGLRAPRPAPGPVLDQVLVRSRGDRTKQEFGGTREGSVEITITAAAGSAGSLDVIEDGSAFGEASVGARADAIAIHGFDGRYASIDVDRGRAAEISDAIANAVRTNVRVRDGR